MMYAAPNKPSKQTGRYAFRSLITWPIALGCLYDRRPVLMVFEDVHWSDPTTRESLDLLIHRVPTLRGPRDHHFPAGIRASLGGPPARHDAELNRLPAKQRAEMIVRVTGGKVLPKEIEQQIVDRTDGVPLFIEQRTYSQIC
jgi:predicted ATPase